MKYIGIIIIGLLLLLACDNSIMDSSKETIKFDLSQEIANDTIPSTLYVYWAENRHYYLDVNKEVIAIYDTTPRISPVLFGIVTLLSVVGWLAALLLFLIGNNNFKK